MEERDKRIVNLRSEQQKLPKMTNKEKIDYITKKNKAPGVSTAISKYLIFISLESQKGETE